MLDTYIVAAITVFAFMCLFFSIGTALKNNGVIDVGWGLGFCVVALVTLFRNEIIFDRQYFITAITLIWGLRIAGYLGIRMIGKPEDFRYAQWRKEWGKNVIWRSFLQIYMLQGGFMLIIALPILLVNTNTTQGLGITDYIGAAVFAIGLFFEAVGDQQNHNFKKNPKNKGKVMKYGLWKYTRHPNYFGESVMWWGIAIIAVKAEYGYLAFISPAVLTFLLLKVSGIPMLEKRYKGNKEYQEYKKHTSAFIPMPRKK